MDKSYIIVAIIILVSIIYLYHMQVLWQTQFVKRLQFTFGLYFSQFEWFNPLYLQDKSGGFKTQSYVEVIYLRLDSIQHAYPHAIPSN